MKKFILHGGKTSLKSYTNELFFSRIAHHKKVNRILFIYFARYKEEWQEKFTSDKELIANYNSDAVSTLASDDHAMFLQQLMSADTIYITGGSTAVLKERLLNLHFDNALLEEKLIAGSSAGACVLSKYYMNDAGEIHEGLGLLPLKIVCHYNETKENSLTELIEYKDNKILTFPIRETEFVEISQ